MLTVGSFFAYSRAFLLTVDSVSFFAYNLSFLLTVGTISIVMLTVGNASNKGLKGL